MQRSGNARSIHDAARCHHGQAAFTRQQLHQRQHAHQAVLLRHKSAAVAACLHTLRHDHIHPGLLNLACLVQVGGASQRGDACSAQCIDKALFWQAKMKADHRGLLLQHHGLQLRVAYGRFVNAAQTGRDLRAVAGKLGGQIAQPLRFTLCIGCCGLVAKQVDVERACGQRLRLRNVLTRLIHPVSTNPYRAQCTCIADSGGQLRRRCPRHGRLNNGVLQTQTGHPQRHIAHRISLIQSILKKLCGQGGWMRPAPPPAPAPRNPAQTAGGSCRSGRR